MIDSNTYKTHFIMPLSSGKPQMEAIEMKAKAKRRTTLKIIISIAAAIFAVLLSNGICFAASGETWVEMIFNYHYSAGNGAADVVIFNDENGSGIIGSADDGPGYSVYEDGKTYFVFGDIKEDITDEISDGNYFKYEYTDGNNVQHLIFVGEGYWDATDDNDNTGYISSWMEIFYTPDGHKSSVAQLGADSSPAWYVKATADYPLYHTENED